MKFQNVLRFGDHAKRKHNLTGKAGIKKISKYEERTAVIDHVKDCECGYWRKAQRDLLFVERKQWKIDHHQCHICKNIFKNRIQAVDHVTKDHEVDLKKTESILVLISPS